MSEQAKQEQKAPVVEIKKAPSKAKPKPKPSLDAATAKQLKELAAELQRIEGLRAYGRRPFAHEERQTGPPRRSLRQPLRPPDDTAQRLHDPRGVKPSAAYRR
jgi:hypothetical protein